VRFSILTRHTSHVTRHTSHVTRHTSHFADTTLGSEHGAREAARFTRNTRCGTAFNDLVPTTQLRLHFTCRWLCAPSNLNCPLPPAPLSDLSLSSSSAASGQRSAVTLRFSAAKCSSAADDRESDGNESDGQEEQDEEVEEEGVEEEEEEEDGWVGVSFGRSKPPMRQQLHSKRSPAPSSASVRKKTRVGSSSSSSSIRESGYSFQHSKVRLPPPCPIVTLHVICPTTFHLCTIRLHLVETVPHPPLSGNVLCSTCSSLHLRRFPALSGRLMGEFRQR
jgi:hypothetical protein